MKRSIRSITGLLLIACLTARVCIAEETAVKTIEKFNLSTGGTGLYRPGKWGLIKVSLRNPQDRDVELLATTHFLGDPTIQYGCRLWMPAASRIIVWHPLKMPALEQPDQRIFDLRSMVLSSSDGAESMATNEYGSMQFDQGFHVALDEPTTAMILNPAESASVGPLWCNSQDFVETARLDRGLKHNFTVLGDALLPAGEELLDSLDHLIIAGDRLLPDASGVSAIRRWVANGGRLWIMADRVSAPLLAAILGDEDTITEVDRVDLTDVKFESGNSSTGTMPFERELEQPVRFVRVIAENLAVDFLVNGWPAAFRKSHGDGQILVTTLGADAWLRPRKPTDPLPPGGKNFFTAFTPGGPLSQLAMEFFVPRTSRPIPRDLAEEQVRQMIGYAIPSRTLVLGTLVGFTLLMLIVAVWLSRCGRLELMGLVVPGLAIVSSGVLLGAGWNSRSTIPATTAIVQMVQVVPGTDEIRTSGLAGVFAKESEACSLAGTQGGWMSPAMAGLEGTTRRMVWSDIDHWSWENFAVTPGLRMVSFQAAGRASVDAVAEFNAHGIIGKLVLPAGMEPADAVIAASRGRMGVEIQPDGTFTALSRGVLGAEEFLSAHVLSDEQQRRNRLLSRMLGPGSPSLPNPVLLVWTKPWPVGMSLVRESETVGSALVSIPLRWQRPTSGTLLAIPAPFLPFREVAGPDGVNPAGLYNPRNGEWVERTGATAGWLAFTIPGNLRPLDVKSAIITFKVVGPMGRLELSTIADLHRRSLKVWENPVGTLIHEIVDPLALKLDSQGRLLVRVDIGHPSNELESTKPVQPNAKSKPVKQGTSDPVSYWKFEDASLQLSAEIPGNAISSPP